MANSKILIVEDDASIADVLDAYLRHDGYATAIARDGDQAIQLHDSWKPDLVLLDYLLPVRNGDAVLGLLRQRGNVAVIMVTALDDEAEKLGALRYGADDYIVKPFNPKEVVARVQAVLRRTQRVDKPTLLRGDGLALDLQAVQAYAERPAPAHNEPIDLTLTEFNLLATLMSAPAKAFSRIELLDACLPESDSLERVIDTHIRNIRRKLQAHGVTHVPHSVRGVGYRFSRA
ncbi:MULTISPECIES: response regulator [Achromobacter]|uniref:response regulator n=1 Tax=Achromobacter TaxID=222 RepID=UPI0006C00C69|nr:MULTISPECIES: response regulator [Achromobacter]CUJ47197.1 Phosphate regulon transcriptional regulatory protein phoB [Achromobacter sp. 2789STDY5608621]